MTQLEAAIANVDAGAIDDRNAQALEKAQTIMDMGERLIAAGQAMMDILVPMMAGATWGELS